MALFFFCAKARLRETLVIFPSESSRPFPKDQRRHQREKRLMSQAPAFASFQQLLMQSRPKTLGATKAHCKLRSLQWASGWSGKSTLWTNAGQDRNFQRALSAIGPYEFPREIRMDRSSVHTFSWGNSYGPMVLKVLLKFPPSICTVGFQGVSSWPVPYHAPRAHSQSMSPVLWWYFAQSQTQNFGAQRADTKKKTTESSCELLAKTSGKPLPNHKYQVSSSVFSLFIGQKADLRPLTFPVEGT